MRLLSARVLVVLTIGALVGAPSQSADIARQLKGLEEFLKWAHPEGDGCASPADVSIVQTWDGGLRARYRIVCGASTRVLQGIFQVREKEGVWQIASGFEADAPRIDEALGLPPDTSAPAGAARGGISPPPRNADGGAPETPLDAVAPPAIRSEPSPEYPEEAGRARLIGEAHIELLVELASDGAPLRARPLRGPDPDLGMRRAAMEAVMRWRFDPARLAGKPLTFFRSVDVTFSGLPPESRDWVHRALFRVEAIVSEDELVVDEALRRVRAGEAFEKVAAESVGSSRGGDWGLVSAATLPAAVRRALHEARVGGLAGPVAAEGLHYLILKRGEVYYALKPRPGGDLTYQVLHQKNAPEGDALKQAVERDIADYLAESRRQIYVNEAARLMGIRQSSAQVGRLEIRTDVLPEDEIKTLGQVVESVVRTQQAFWSPLVTLRPFNQQILVYAWAREADHDRLHRMWQAGSAGPVPEPPAEPERAASKTKLWSFIGEYLPASHILSVPCERMGGHLNVPILIHEAIHMLDYERVYAAGARPSQWFEEGLATYFGFSQIGARLDIEPGDIRRSGTIVSGNVRLQFDPRTPLQEYLRKIRDDGPMPLRALLESGAGDPTWTGERTIRAYCASWTLVHFLLHGAKGARRAEFEEYARAEARGAGGYDTFVRLFGPDLASLEAAWHRYEENL